MNGLKHVAYKNDYIIKIYMISSKLLIDIFLCSNDKKKLKITLIFNGKINVIMKIKYNDILIYKNIFHNLIYDDKKNTFLNDLIELNEKYIKFNNINGFNNQYVSEIFNSNEKIINHDEKILHVPYKILGMILYGTNINDLTYVNNPTEIKMRIIYHDKNIFLYYDVSITDNIKIIENTNEKLFYNYKRKLYEYNVSNYVDKIISENILNYIPIINKIIFESLLSMNNKNKINTLMDIIKKIKCRYISNYEFDNTLNLYNEEGKYIIKIFTNKNNIDTNTYNHFKFTNFVDRFVLDNTFIIFLMISIKDLYKKIYY